MMRGEVAIAGRVGRERLWDLPERVYPADVVVPSVDEAAPGQERAAARLARHRPAEGHAMPMEPVDVGEAGEPAVVEGVKGEWRVDPAALGDDFEGRTALLSPFDRLVHDRRRAQELFDFEYTLEMYKPAAKRRWGYFALPVLHDDRLVGKVDATADHKASVLRVNAIHEDVKFTRTMTKAVQAELEDLASWLGLGAVERGRAVIWDLRRASSQVTEMTNPRAPLPQQLVSLTRRPAMCIGRRGHGTRDHALLGHLEHAGFDGAPRVVGFDDRAERCSRTWRATRDRSHFPPALLHERGMVGLGRLIRRFHDAVAAFVPAADAVYRIGARPLGRGDRVPRRPRLLEHDLARRRHGRVDRLGYRGAGPADPRCRARSDDLPSRCTATSRPAASGSSRHSTAGGDSRRSARATATSHPPRSCRRQQSRGRWRSSVSRFRSRRS